MKTAGLINAIVQYGFAGFLAVVGVDLGWRGLQLASLGGSPYYLLAGLALVAVAALTALRLRWAPRLYAMLLAATLVWALTERGLDLLGLLPRLMSFIVVGLWFAMPWTRGWFRMSAAPKSRFGANLHWTEFAITGSAIALLAAASQGYSVNHTDVHAPAAGPVTSNWRAYGNQDGGQRFAQLDQINTRNVASLTEVWRYRTSVAYDFKATPLEVGGLVYLCTGGDTLIALDADTGQERWRTDTHTKAPGQSYETASSFARTCRGLGYHEQPNATGACARRILNGTTDGRLLAVDALTGAPCEGFGFNGVVDLNSGLGPHPEGNYMVTSPPLVAGNIAVVGGWVSDNQKLGNVSGVLRAYDAVTGKFAWAWDMGRPGDHSQPAEGDEYTRGTPNVWSIMSYDPQLNLIFAPTGNAGPDYFDGNLRSEAIEKYASSVVAIDAASGEPRWSFQTVHRDVWDYDVPAQPVLLTLHKDGRDVPALVAPTKRGEIFVLDRRDGQPVWPVTERAVPQNPEAGERLSPTQPFSSVPTFGPDLSEADMWGLTPLDQLACRVAFKKLRYEGQFTPPTRASGKYEGSLQYPGNYGGYNWGSVSVDADNGLLIAAPMMLGNKVVAMNAADRAAAIKAGTLADDSHGDIKGAEMNDPRFDQSKVGLTAEAATFMSPWQIPFLKKSTQMPCMQPPYGMIGVIDLNTNKMLWKRPFGSMRDSGPFGVSSGLPFMVGAPILGGSVTTRGGLIFHGGAMDETLRAFDTRTGQVKWETQLPGSAQATPISYLSPRTGKQFVVITVPNPSWRYPWPKTQPSDDKGGYVIAYALKENTAH